MANLRLALEDDISGGVAVFGFRFGNRRLKPGDKLTEAEVRSIPRANLRALKAQGRIHVLTKSGEATEPGEIFTIHRGAGKYDVVEGTKINDAPLTKEEAEALATPAPEQTH